MTTTPPANAPALGPDERDVRLADWPCKRCKHPQTRERSHESSCGGYDDYQYTCPACGHLFNTGR